MQYRFRGYTPPDELEAFGVQVNVTHVGDDQVPTSEDLSEMRTALEENGFKRDGATQLKTHRGGRYEPLWREVWVREEPEEEPEKESRPRSSSYGLHGYSLEVQKRLETSSGPSGHFPFIARTQHLVIVRRPRWSGSRVGKLMAQDMTANLPQFRFNSRKNRWEAPLEELEKAYEHFKPHVVLSRGVQEYLAEGV